MIVNDVYLNNNWFSLKDVDVKRPAQYLCRSKNETYKNCISVLVIQDKTWFNGGWVFLNGNSVRLVDLIEYYEIAGPIYFNARI